MNTVEIDNFLAREAPLFIPIGTLEAHGRHLPVGTDTFCAEKISEELSLHFSGAVAPSIEYGVTNSLAQTAPASFFSHELFEEFVYEIVKNFINHGFKSIVIVNGHGGNTDPLKNVARKLIKSHKAALSVIHWWKLSSPFVKPVFNVEPGGHAAVEETAAMLHFYPTLVDPDNYDSATDDYVADNGIWLYPPPGEVIIDKAGTGQPDFDCGKAADFMAAVLKDIIARLNRWFASMNRLSGGLRP
jgi:creatinine amidohydrolase